MLKKANQTRKQIFLVDDDPSITKMLRMLLETRGYTVAIANSGKEALRNISGQTDLILLDLILPDQAGFEICRKLRQNHKTAHIPIIMLTAKLLSEDIIEGLYLGADDYLTKPFEYEELIARMEAVMRRQGAYPFQNVNLPGEDNIIEELRKLIDEELIVSFMQPVYQLEPMKIIGFEALTRPKTKSILANPEFLFKAAVQYGFYQDLEILSWRKALEKAEGFITTEKLFLNCNPYLVEGPKFLSIQSLFEHSSLKPENVILEITERSAISDFQIFYEHLKRYRDFGFKFAIDDVGGGYASLESIVRTKPEVVKIDRHIVCDLYEDPFKQSIIKFIVTFCKENNILSIAEGIENKKDLQTIKSLGVDAAQGFYLCKPTPKVDVEALNTSLSLLKF